MKGPTVFTAAFWLAAGERAVKTFAQALVALFAADVTVLSIDWAQAFAIAGTAALVSVLTSMASAGFGPTGSPSLVADAAAAPYVGAHEAPVAPDVPPAATEDVPPAP